MRPKRGLGSCQKLIQAHKDKATSFSPAEEWVLQAASTKEPEEREFVVDSGASMHMVSKKDVNSAGVETMRGIRRRCNHGYGLAIKKPHLIKKGKRINCNTSNCVQFVVSDLSTSSFIWSTLLLQHLHRRILWSARKEVKLWVRGHGENRRVDQQKPKTKKKETTKNYEVNYCKICQNDCSISKRIWWVRMFNRINTLPAVLMNYQWSASKSDTRSRKTQYLYSLPERPKLWYLLEEK